MDCFINHIGIITLGGAALGFGVDKLTGGNGWKGAAIGGAMGLAATYVPPINFGSGGGGASNAISIIDPISAGTRAAMDILRGTAKPVTTHTNLSLPTSNGNFLQGMKMNHSIRPNPEPTPLASSPTAVSNFYNTTPWMKTAIGELGVKELTGDNDGPDIDKYLATVGGAKTGWAWCAAFVNWVLKRNNIKGTGQPNALSYLSYGQSLSRPAYGSIAVIDHGKGLGHVGFVVGKTSNGSIILLGGNQGHMVKYSSFSKNSIKKFVYPRGYLPSYNLPTLNNISSSSFSQTR